MFTNTDCFGELTFCCLINARISDIMNIRVSCSSFQGPQSLKVKKSLFEFAIVTVLFFFVKFNFLFLFYYLFIL